MQKNARGLFFDALTRINEAAVAKDINLIE